MGSGRLVIGKHGETITYTRCLPKGKLLKGNASEADKDGIRHETNAE